MPKLIFYIWPVKEGSRGTNLTQTTAIGKVVHLIWAPPPYAQTEQLSLD